ncbi:hypothetical protein CEXT_442581 [Caerostris extrusa]|uniref:Uncharacterized protein n=1 Tax=Caerostris extrusa TaxID=172846 RepID=A0AAV4PH01_CAEEX|nr:hypothetical protein CEXT_442581 [Caerostris extrusa]
MGIYMRRIPSHLCHPHPFQESHLPIIVFGHFNGWPSSFITLLEPFAEEDQTYGPMGEQIRGAPPPGVGSFRQSTRSPAAKTTTRSHSAPMGHSGTGAEHVFPPLRFRPTDVNAVLE